MKLIDTLITCIFNPSLFINTFILIHTNLDKNYKIQKHEYFRTKLNNPWKLSSWEQYRIRNIRQSEARYTYNHLIKSCH